MNCYTVYVLRNARIMFIIRNLIYFTFTKILWCLASMICKPRQYNHTNPSVLHKIRQQCCTRVSDMCYMFVSDVFAVCPTVGPTLKDRFTAVDVQF